MGVSESITSGDDLNEVERLVKQHPEHARSLIEKLDSPAKDYLKRVVDDVTL